MRSAATLLLALTGLVTACGEHHAAELKKLPQSPDAERAPLPSAGGAELIAELGCSGCHPGVGGANEAREHSPSLADVGSRRSPGYIYAYLAEPSRVRLGSARARMPDFHLDDRERLALTLYLGDLRAKSVRADRSSPAVLSEDEVRSLDAAFQQALAANPEVTDTTGRRIYTALGCTGCHSGPSGAQWLVGPDLAAEGSRVKTEWLRAFLEKPRAIRPFGAYVGSGSRMPDFHLSSDEVDSLAAFLAEKQRSLAAAAPPSHPIKELSTFDERKIERLLRDRFACLGCHELGDEGGRIGPDLTRVGARLRPAYIQVVIADPRHAVPGTIMPLAPIPRREVARITAYLAARDSSPVPPSPSTGPSSGTARPSPAIRPPYDSPSSSAAASSLAKSPARARPQVDTARAGYLSLVDNVPTIPIPGNDSRALYGRICANCHGASGDGDGWNAAYLPVRPTAHADGAYMSTRSDDVIYDAIAAGGYILDRSNRMPPFGETLARAEIQSLVRYIRELCHCEGPAWSRDGAIGASP